MTDASKRQRLVPAQAVAVVCLVALLAYGHHGLWERLPDPGNQGGRSDEQAIIDSIEERAGLADGDKIYAISQPWFVLASDREHVGVPYYYLWSGVFEMIGDREGHDEALIQPILDERPKLVVLPQQRAQWIYPWERSAIQNVYAETLLLNYERIPPAAQGSLIRVTRAADYWVLASGVNFTERIHGSAGLPGAIGGWTADDMQALAGDPTMVRQQATSMFASTNAWELDDQSGVDAIGPITLRVPDNLHPDDRALYLSAIVALSEDGVDEDQVALTFRLSRAVPDDEPRNEAPQMLPAQGVRDVSDARADQLLLVTQEARLGVLLDAQPGEEVTVSIERDGDDPQDTYEHGLRVLGLTIAYRPAQP